jgi:hypothetical protein
MLRSKGTHDIMAAVSVTSKDLIQVVNFHVQAVIITYAEKELLVQPASVMGGVQILSYGRGLYVWVSCIQYVPASHPVFCSTEDLRKIVLCSVPLPHWI